MTNQEKKRLRYLLTGLGIVVSLFAMDQFGLLEYQSDPQSGISPARKRVLTPTLAGQSNARKGERASGDVANEELRTLHPLPLTNLTATTEESEPAKRNPFVYHVPTEPQKEPEPTVAPPIVIRTLTPSSVYAGTGDFTLRIVSRDFPEDAQVFVNARPVPMMAVTKTELTVTVDEQSIATPGQLQITVRNSAGDLFSNTQTLTVQAPPKPTYKFIGRIDNLVFLQKGTDQRLRSRVGETVENRWRVAEVDGENIVLEDVTLGIEHRVALEDRAPAPPARTVRTTTQRFTPRRTVARPSPQPTQRSTQQQPTRPSTQQRQNPPTQRRNP